MIPIVNHFTGPLTDVSKQMNEIAEGNLDARIEVNSTDEIGEVGASFNVMAKRLQENIVEMVEQEKREQQLKYGLMISQVDPHFIYNTMNMITYLAQKNRNEDVIAVNKAMIQILRDRLRIEVDNVYDTVEQEIKVVREYLLIQKYRYTGIFKSVIDIEAGVEPYLIAKNILQPLVENAFFHGILCNTDEEGEVIDGCITIRIRMEEDEVEIIVKDNGAGMSQDKLDELSKPQRKLSSMERGEHIGIKNIKERLDYIYENNWKNLRSIQVGAAETIFNSQDNVLLAASTASGFRQLYQVKLRNKRMEEVLCSSKNCYMEPFYISNEGNLCV